MGMQVGSSAGEADVMVEMNMTPSIDVLFVLIILLIITIPPQNHSVDLNMPTNQPPTENLEPPVVLTVDVDFDGTVLFDGVAVQSRAEIESKFQQIGALPIKGQPEVHLRPNKLVEYKSVAAVMASAQRNGVKKLGMVGNEQFLP